MRNSGVRVRAHRPVLVKLAPNVEHAQNHRLQQEVDLRGEADDLSCGINAAPSPGRTVQQIQLKMSMKRKSAGRPSKKLDSRSFE